MKVNIGTASKHFGVSQETLRRWEKSGKILVERTPKGHRRFDLTKTPSTSEKLCSKKHTLGYAPVSSHDQKEDLIRQAQVLENFCTANGWTYEILQALGSGLNFQKKGLKKLIQNICSEKIDRLLLTHKRPSENKILLIPECSLPLPMHRSSLTSKVADNRKE